MPIQRPIPIWLGGLSPVAYRRMGRLADGWFPRVEPGPDLEAACAIIAEGATEAGRDPAAIGLQPRVSWGAGDADELIGNADRWRDAGATRLAVDTMGSGLTGLDAHLDALARGRRGTASRWACQAEALAGACRTFVMTAAHSTVPWRMRAAGRTNDTPRMRAEIRT